MELLPFNEILSDFYEIAPHAKSHQHSADSTVSVHQLLECTFFSFKNNNKD